MEQAKEIRDIEQLIVDRLPKSAEILERAKKVLLSPTVTGPFRSPRGDAFIKEAKGSKIIDVDGNEYLILRGMNKLLKSIERPRSIQVEVIKRNNASILSFMENHNYVLSDKHYTRGPARRIAQGDDPVDYHYNGIFRPVS